MEVAMETIHSESCSFLIEQHAHDQEKPKVLELPLFYACWYDDRFVTCKTEFGGQSKALIKTKSDVLKFPVFYARGYADHSNLCKPEFGGQNKALIKTNLPVSEFPVFYACERVDRSDLIMTEFGAQDKALIQVFTYLRVPTCSHSDLNMRELGALNKTLTHDFTYLRVATCSHRVLARPAAQESIDGITAYLAARRDEFLRESEQVGARSHQPASHVYATVKVRVASPVLSHFDGCPLPAEAVFFFS